MLNHLDHYNLKGSMTMSKRERVFALVEKIRECEAELDSANSELDELTNGKPSAKSAKPSAKGQAAPKRRGRPPSASKKAEQVAAANSKDEAPKRRGRPPGSGNKNKKPAADKGKKNQQPLTKLIPQILAPKDGGEAVWMTHAQIVGATLKRGYASASDDFNNIVYQNLRKKVRDGELIYDDDQSKFALAPAA